MKILPEMYLWTRKSTLNFGSHASLDPDLGIFSDILPLWNRGNSVNFDYKSTSCQTNSYEFF